ncbi:hypothetical protein M6B38_418215 [Iris pallida]|uniref:Uncharacterized protein n=1 Tax=Iris pallida TaxID=29817 RepID=A0AAX6EF96_IRIPA|nr:hypothetical protein M6B38_191975 [Iris pallida]KAJ6816235.1 hypothetical protein M6B38_418215 [Iris pallida]
MATGGSEEGHRRVVILAWRTAARMVWRRGKVVGGSHRSRSEPVRIWPRPLCWRRWMKAAPGEEAVGRGPPPGRRTEMRSSVRARPRRRREEGCSTWRRALQDAGLADRRRKTCCHDAMAELDRTTSSAEDRGVVRARRHVVGRRLSSRRIRTAPRRGDGSGFGGEVRDTRVRTRSQVLCVWL